MGVAGTATGQTLLARVLAGARRLRTGAAATVELATPVIIDLDGRGVQTLDRSVGVRYDLDGDGVADPTSWIGPTEGFLFLDRDGNGTLTNAGEFSFVADLQGATSDLQGLRAFDSSGDGALSATDKRFGDFRVWQDKNTNGSVDAGEILTLAAAGVRSIPLTATPYTGSTVSSDVAIVAVGSYLRIAGSLTMDFLDAALTFLPSGKGELPSIEFAASTFDRKAGKYRVIAAGGQLSVVARHRGQDTDERAGGMVGAFTMDFRDRTVGILGVVVLDLDGDGLSLLKSRKSRGWFDMNGDGSPDQQGWVGARDGMLVIDRNANGVIDDGSELSFLTEAPAAASGLAALAKLDSNGDKLLDKRDARFADLRVWIDANRNGTTDAGELRTLADLDIVSIGLDAKNLSRTVKPGENILLATAIFTYANGMVRTVGDAALAFRPSSPPASLDTNEASLALRDPAAAAEQEGAALPSIDNGAGDWNAAGRAASLLATAMATFDAPVSDLAVAPGYLTTDARANDIFSSAQAPVSFP